VSDFAVTLLPSCSGGLQSICPVDLASHRFDATATALACAGPRGRVVGMMRRGETRHRPLMLLPSRPEFSRNALPESSSSSDANPRLPGALAALRRSRQVQRLSLCRLGLRLVSLVLPNLPRSASLRPRVFSTPRRFIPYLLLRPCFMPVPSMGFHAFEGFSPPVAPGASRLAVSSMSSSRSRATDSEDFGTGWMRCPASHG
jgi:hypothetical protein